MKENLRWWKSILQKIFLKLGGREYLLQNITDKKKDEKKK